MAAWTLTLSSRGDQVGGSGGGKLIADVDVHGRDRGCGGGGEAVQCNSERGLRRRDVSAEAGGGGRRGGRRDIHSERRGGRRGIHSGLHRRSVGSEG